MTRCTENSQWVLWFALVGDCCDILADVRNPLAFTPEAMWFGLYQSGRSPMQAAKLILKAKGAL